MRYFRVRSRALLRGAGALVRHEPLACATVLGLALAAAVWVGAPGAPGQRGAAVGAGAALLVWLAHGGRTDERFLRTAGLPHRRIYAAEYALAALPVALPLACSAHPWTALAPFAGVAAAAMPAGRLRSREARGRAARIPGPADAFEWKPGLRAALPAVLAVYALAALLARFPAAPLLGVGVLAWTSAGVYVAGEGWPMVEALGRGPGAFLRRKTLHALGHWGVLSAPLVLLFAALHPALWPVGVAVLCGCATLVAGGVLLKYALFHEGRLPTLPALLGLLALGASLAVPPVALFLLFRFGRQAARNLEPYLYAFD
jgi:hypothetical protein